MSSNNINLCNGFKNTQLHVLYANTEIFKFKLVHLRVKYLMKVYRINTQ